MPQTSTPADIRHACLAKLDDVDVAQRTVTAVITTDAIDSEREVVAPEGIGLARYQKNPVVLWMHGKDPSIGRVPIGKNLWIKAKGKRALVAKTKFATTEFAETLWQLYREEFLRAWSVGGQPDWKECGPPTPEEIRRRPDLANARTFYRKVTLTEYSAVDVGANPDALTLVASKGLYLPDALAKAWQAQTDAVSEPENETENETLPDLPRLVGRSFGDVHAALVRRLRSEAAEIATGRADELLDLARGRV